jgi:hypothetical protein
VKADFSWSGATLAGLGVMRREPRALLLWSLVGLVFALFDQVLDTRADILGKTGYSGTWIVPMFSLARGVVGAVAMAIFSAAVYRAVLRPEGEARGRMRFGADEIRLTLVWLLQGVLLLVLTIAAIVPAYAVSTLTAKRNDMVTGIVGTAVAVGILVAWIVLLLRLSLAAPMALAERRWSVPAAWRMTKGHALKILAVHLPLLLALGLALSFSKTLYLLVLGVTHIGASASFFPRNAASLPELFAPVRLAFTVISAVLGAVAAVMLYAPAAAIYRDLRGDEPADQAAVFD